MAPVSSFVNRDRNKYFVRSFGLAQRQGSCAEGLAFRPPRRAVVCYAAGRSLLPTPRGPAGRCPGTLNSRMRGSRIFTWSKSLSGFVCQYAPAQTGQLSGFLYSASRPFGRKNVHNPIVFCCIFLVDAVFRTRQNYLRYERINCRWNCPRELLSEQKLCRTLYR